MLSTSLTALEFPCVYILSLFLIYVALSANILKLSLSSSNLIFPFTINIFDILSYSNSSPLIKRPSGVVAIPPFFP